MVNSISIDSLHDKIASELDNYRRGVVDKALETSTAEAMKALVKKTKETAPVGKRSKHYRDKIASKVLLKRDVGAGRTYSEIWYVKAPDYRLSHLLENGHATRDGGRTEGTHFIARALDPIEKEYLKKLEEEIQN